jgi:putative integral membrane protein (TIGR02587 family)
MDASVRQSLRKEIHDLAKGATGALIFGIPLLYTMEVWFDGKSLGPRFHFFFLLVMIGANMLMTYFAGFHSHIGKSLYHHFFESISSCGMGIVLSGIVLWIIGSINSFTDHGIGVILLEGLIMSIGISFANFKFRGFRRNQNLIRSSFSIVRSLRTEDNLIQELISSVFGAVVFSLNVAPTEEVTLIAARISQGRLILLMALEFLSAYLILSVVSTHLRKRWDVFQHPLVHALHIVAVSLVVSGCLILALGYGSPVFHSTLFLHSTVVLALPAVIGASAGRLIL